MDVDKESAKNFDLLSQLVTSAMAYIGGLCAYAIGIIISCSSLCYFLKKNMFIHKNRAFLINYMFNPYNIHSPPVFKQLR